jgi:hypothetical protein
VTDYVTFTVSNSFVRSHQGEVQGWVNQLRNPEHWQPGCIAVDERDRMWTTIAGSERDGALMWLANHEL